MPQRDSRPVTWGVQYRGHWCFYFHSLLSLGASPFKHSIDNIPLLSNADIDHNNAEQLTIHFLVTTCWNFQMILWIWSAHRAVFSSNSFNEISLKTCLRDEIPCNQFRYGRAIMLSSRTHHRWVWNQPEKWMSIRQVIYKLVL